MMRTSWRLGRVAGIDLYLHPTLLLLLAWYAAGRGGLIEAALIAAIFGCVMLHELGHALAARRFGIGTRDITLYPIGGVARLERMPKSPGAEMLIALAGPAVNVAIASALGLLYFVAAPADAWDANPMGELALQLAACNVGLAAFNMIPSFPMDGGRVLRALLSGWLGRVRATEIAAGLGRALAVAFGVAGLATGHLMWAVLALFIYFAAGAELRQVHAEGRQAERRGDDDWPSPPPGYRWVPRGKGVWGLAPAYVTVDGRHVRDPWT